MGAWGPGGRHQEEGLGASALHVLLHIHIQRHRAQCLWGPCIVLGTQNRNVSRATALQWLVLWSDDIPNTVCSYSLLSAWEQWAVAAYPAHSGPKSFWGSWLPRLDGLLPTYGLWMAFKNHSSSPKIPHWPPSHAFDEVDDGISQKVKKNDRLFLPYLSLVWIGT